MGPTGYVGAGFKPAPTTMDHTLTPTAPLTPHSSPLTPQRKAPPLTPHSSPLTPQRKAPPPLTQHTVSTTIPYRTNELIPATSHGLTTMTLSQIIKLRTDSGGDIVDFLVDVMQDQYEDFRICHRLQAARLLTTYGNEDASNFIAETTPDSSPRRDRPNSKRQTKFDTELARLIREDTGDGRSIARFLVNVMVGELRSFRPHHRMAAARELLNRGFGKPAHTEPEPARHARTPIRRSGEGRNPPESYTRLQSSLRRRSAPSHSSLLSTHSSARSAPTHS